MEVPPHSFLEVTGHLEAAVEGVWVLEETTDKRPLFAVARALVEPTSTMVPVRVLNPTSEPVTVYGGVVLGRLEMVESRMGSGGSMGEGGVAGVGGVMAGEAEVMVVEGITGTGGMAGDGGAWEQLGCRKWVGCWQQQQWR